MSTKQIDRLIFAQGGRCFFCAQALSKNEASVEHLVAAALGGSDSDENCVACCKALNGLFGRMSLKEKIQIVLNQKGVLICPRPHSALLATAASAKKLKLDGAVESSRTFMGVVEDLQKRGNARPGTVDKLLNTIKSYLGQIGDKGTSSDAVLVELKAKGFVNMNGVKVVYALPSKGALPPS